MLRLLVCILILAVTVGIALAVPTNGADIVLQSGDYEVHVRPSSAWTPSKILYSGLQVGLGNGFYGAVFWKSGGQFIGTGHTEGGTEIVTNLIIEVDGVNKGEPVPGTTYKGELITFIKKSRLDMMDEHWILKVSTNGVREELSLVATAEQYLQGLYAFMHPIFTNTTLWMAGDDSKTYEGECRSAGGWELNKEIKWVTLYSPGDQVGVLVSYPETYKAYKIKNGIWDLKRYHKLYLQSVYNETLAKGDTRSWKMDFKCYPATIKNWKKVAKSRVK